MGAKLRSLSGRDLVAIFEQFGFAAVSSNGSHMKLRRMTPFGSQTLVIPLHAELPKGTLRAIFGQATRFIQRDELHPYFYTSPH